MHADAAPAAAAEVSCAPELKRYGYRVGPFGLLAAERTRSEVVRAPVISAVPHSPRWLLGLMNLRGNLVPVADLRIACGEAAPLRPAATVLVLGTGEGVIGLAIDALPIAIADLQALPAVPPLPSPLDSHVSAAFEGVGRTWLEFNHEEFFRALARGPGVQS